MCGLQYEYFITEHLQLYARTSYVISNIISLRGKSKNNILQLNNDNSLYLRTGIRIKI